MVVFIVISIILIVGFSLEKIRANNSNPNQFSISIPTPIAMIVRAVYISVFAFCFFEDAPFLLAVSLLLAGTMVCFGLYDLLKDLENAESETEVAESKSDNESKGKTPWWAWTIIIIIMLCPLIAMLK